MPRQRLVFPLKQSATFYLFTFCFSPRKRLSWISFSHFSDFYSSGDVSVGLEWLGAAGGGGSVEHKGQEDVSRLLPTVSTHPTVVELKIKNQKKQNKENIKEIYSSHLTTKPDRF